MKGASFSSLACIAALIFFAPSAKGQIGERRLVGKITDRWGRPIEYANVQINAAGRVVTDFTGAFSISAPQDRHFVVDVRRIGFSPAHLELGTTPDSTIHIVLEAIATRLDTVRATADAPVSVHLVLSGFYDRMRQSTHGSLSGKFVTPEDIEFRQPQHATQMIEDIGGVRVRPISGTDKLMVFGSDGCTASIYFNGVRLNKLATRGGSEALSAYFDDIADPSALAGIEVYARGTRAPPQYQGLNGSCAVVLIWTK